MSIGVLIGNLGTPESPEVKDVRAYLREFLMDPYVIDRPVWFRWLLVNLIIAPFRSPKSAAAYKSIWMKEGSPLMVYSQRLVTQLQTKMGAAYQVELGMRYGKPSLHQAFEKLHGCEKIFLAPQYPQYAQSSYSTWLEKAQEEAEKLGVRDRLVILEPFFSDPDYLKAQSLVITESWKQKSPEYLLFSYHGLPERHLRKASANGEHHCLKARCVEELTDENRNCYRAQCYFVSREMARSLNLTESQWGVSFQSRLGPEPWLTPFTDHVVESLAERYAHIAVAMPAFTVDCLETVEEIGERAKESFIEKGGRDLTAIPCLNVHPEWVNSLAQMIQKRLS